MDLCDGCRTAVRKAPGPGWGGSGMLWGEGSGRWMVALVVGLMIIAPMFFLRGLIPEFAIELEEAGAKPSIPESVTPSLYAGGDPGWGERYRQLEKTLAGIGGGLRPPGPGAGARADRRSVDFRFSDSELAGTVPGRIHQMAQAQTNAMIQFHGGYLSEMSQAGYDDFLDAARMAGDEDFGDSYATVAECREVVRRYRELELGLVRGIPARVHAIKLDREVEAAVLHAVLENQPETVEQVGRVWDLQEKVLGNMEEMAQFLEGRRGHWAGGEDGCFLMDNEADLGTFERIKRSTDTYIASQEKIRGQMAESVEKEVRRLREMLVE